MTPGLALRVMLDIGEDGSVKACFRQETIRLEGILMPVY